MTEIPAASVIIPLFQDEATIGRCLSSLEKQTLRDRIEIIVVDDGSRDQSPAIAKTFTVQVVRQDNAGPAAARNRGSEMARAEILLFLDADCEVGSDWVTSILSYFEDDAVTAAFCPLRASDDGIVQRLVQSELDDRYDYLQRREDDNDFIAAAACAVRRSAFRAVGGFNEFFRMNEDVELAYQLRAAGGRIAFARDAPVGHAHQTSLYELLRAKFFRGVWRMRLYRMFPEKRRTDSWTPTSLKVQILAALALMGTLLLSVAFPVLLVAAAGLLALILVSARNLLSATRASLAPLAGWAASIHAAVWVVSRAGVLAAAVICFYAIPWAPIERRHLVKRNFGS